MGAGAGYNIYLKNAKQKGDIEVISVSVNDRYHGFIDVVCKIPLIGDVSSESYYYGCDYVKDVPMTVTSVDGLSLHIDYEDGDRIFDPDTIERFEEDFGEDWAYHINDLDFDADDINLNYVKEILGNIYFGESDIESKTIGGGWSHSDFDGEFAIEVDDGYNDDDCFCTIQIEDQGVIDFLDKATLGENVEYEVEFNGDFVEAFEDQDDAEEWLKKEINDAISNGEDVDLSECAVYVEYWQLLNAEGETEPLMDYSEKVYDAETDPDYEDYLYGEDEDEE